MDRSNICAHCSGDMNKNWRCSHGGICESIEDFDQRKLRELTALLAQPNNGFLAPEIANLTPKQTIN